MSEHIFLPSVELGKKTLIAEHEAWLTAWLHELEQDLEQGDIASSLCLQGVIAEIALYGNPKTDWIGIMDEYLVHDHKPIAYSEGYGKRLYKFAQWLQTDVHAIHARWWIDRIYGAEEHFDYKELIEGLIQPTGWIYNPLVSPTGMRTRMKSEYLMSLAMGLEILRSFDGLEEKRALFEGVLSTENMTGYLSAEYFRICSLKTLNSLNLAPKTIDTVLLACEVGDGYCDFDVKGKIDDYMGTAKRIGRDIPVHSALSTLHAAELAAFCEDEIKVSVARRVVTFGIHIKNKPLDIQAFRMREIDAPFGTGLSPLELVAASSITSRI